MSKLTCVNNFSENAFRDKRLFYRCNKILRDCLDNPNGSIPEISKDYHQSKAVYRFLDNDNVKWKNLLKDWSKQLAKMIINSRERILVAQDTTSLDFTSKPKTKNLGYLEMKNLYGIKSHSALAITKAGEPLGLLSQINWVRDISEYGKKKDSNKKPIEEKESYIWLKTFKNLQELGLENFVLIGDRESDLFDLFNLERKERQHILVRSRFNRRIKFKSKNINVDTETNTNTEINNKLKLLDSLDSKTKYNLNIEVPRSRKQNTRIAKCKLSFGESTIIQQSLNIKTKNLKTNEVELKKVKQAGEVKLSLVTLEEKDCPKGDTPILWRLITTLPVSNKEQAKEIINFYKQRWLVEEFYYTLKSGCQVEELHLKEKENILNMLMIYNLVSCKILNLCYLARIEPNKKATKNAFSLQELQVLYNYHKVKNPRLVVLSDNDNNNDNDNNKSEKSEKSENQYKTYPPNIDNPSTIPNIHTAIIQVAKLGGFLARKNDGLPGVKTIWRGLRKLAIMEEYHEMIFVGKG